MKITVERAIEASGQSFKIYLDGNITKIYSFKLDAPEGDVYNEEYNRQLALKYAEMLSVKPTTEIIYENEI